MVSSFSFDQDQELPVCHPPRQLIMYFIPNWFNKPAQAAVIRFFILSQPNTSLFSTVDFCLYIVEQTIYRETHCLCSECTGLLCCAASHCLPSVKSGLIFSFLDFTVQSKHGAPPPPSWQVATTIHGGLLALLRLKQGQMLVSCKKGISYTYCRWKRNGKGTKDFQKICPAHLFTMQGFSNGYPYF